MRAPCRQNAVPRAPVAEPNQAMCTQEGFSTRHAHVRVVLSRGGNGPSTPVDEYWLCITSYRFMENQCLECRNGQRLLLGSKAGLVHHLQRSAVSHIDVYDDAADTPLLQQDGANLSDHKRADT